MICFGVVKATQSRFSAETITTVAAHRMKNQDGRCKVQILENVCKHI